MTKAELRKIIDRTDGRIIRLLDQRMRTAKQIYTLKKTIVDRNREKKVRKRYSAAGYGKICDEIIKRSREVQHESKKSKP